MSTEHVALSLIVVVAMLAFSTADASSDEFYKNKTVRIIVGFAPGGGFDAYSRVIARHFGKHIPVDSSGRGKHDRGGQPYLANYLYKIAKPDGLTIGNFYDGS